MYVYHSPPSEKMGPIIAVYLTYGFRAINPQDFLVRIKDTYSILQATFSILFPRGL